MRTEHPSICPSPTGKSLSNKHKGILVKPVLLWLILGLVMIGSFASAQGLFLKYGTEIGGGLGWMLARHLLSLESF